MDKRFKPLTREQQFEKRINLTETIKAHPDWTIAQVVAHIRAELQLTLHEMSRFSKVSTKTLQNIEDGIGNPTLVTLDKILNRFGMKMAVTLINTKPSPPMNLRIHTE